MTSLCIISIIFSRFTSECTVARDHSSVTYVKRASLSLPTYRNITWCTRERNHMNVRYVGNPNLCVVFYLPFYTLHMQALYSENVTVCCLNLTLHLRNVDVKPRV